MKICVAQPGTQLRSRCMCSLGLSFLLISDVIALSQPATIHQFSSISRQPDQSITLTLSGKAKSNFLPYYDIFAIESSTDLVQWQPMVTLVRTNQATNAVM